MTTPRMRTAEGLLEIIRAEDPDTAVTLRAIRRMIHTGEIPSTAVGCKRLVNVDLVLRYLAGDSLPDAPSPPTYTD